MRFQWAMWLPHFDSNNRSRIICSQAQTGQDRVERGGDVSSSIRSVHAFRCKAQRHRLAAKAIRDTNPYQTVPLLNGLTEGRFRKLIAPFADLLDRLRQRAHNGVGMRTTEACLGFFEIAGNSPDTGQNLDLR